MNSIERYGFGTLTCSSVCSQHQGGEYALLSLFLVSLLALCFVEWPLTSLVRSIPFSIRYLFKESLSGLIGFSNELCFSPIRIAVDGTCYGEEWLGCLY